MYMHILILWYTFLLCLSTIIDVFYLVSQIEIHCNSMVYVFLMAYFLSSIFSFIFFYQYVRIEEHMIFLKKNVTLNIINVLMIEGKTSTNKLLHISNYVRFLIIYSYFPRKFCCCFCNFSLSL